LLGLVQMKTDLMNSMKFVITQTCCRA
jgi:hypothetical protein